MARNQLIQIRRDSAANWATAQTNAGATPVLLQGEFGYDVTNNVLKVGDGSTLWGALPAVTAGTLSTDLVVGKGGTGRKDGAAAPFSMFSLGADRSIGTMSSSGTYVLFNRAAALLANTAYDVELMVSASMVAPASGSGQLQINYDATNSLTLQTTGMAGVYQVWSNTTSPANLTNANTFSYAVSTGTTPLTATTLYGSGATALTAGLTYYFKIFFRGYIKTNAAGNIQPSFSWTGASSATSVTVNSGSFMKLTPIGAGTTTNISVGTWA